MYKYFYCIIYVVSTFAPPSPTCNVVALNITANCIMLINCNCIVQISEIVFAKSNHYISSI